MKTKQLFDLTVREVKDMLPKIPQSREFDPRLPDLPGVCLLIMKVKSGKSNLLSNLLLNSNFYGGPVNLFDTIYVVSPTIKIDKSSQPFLRKELEEKVVIFDDMKRLEPFLKDLLKYQKSFDLFDPDNLPPQVALIFDDISGHLKRNSNIANLFSRYRHYNISIFCSNQTIRGLPGICRSMATSVWLSSSYSTLEREKVFEEFGSKFNQGWIGKKKMRLEHMWDYCVKDRFNYCYLRFDDIEPRIFKIGQSGVEEIDWKLWNFEYVIDTTEPTEQINTNMDNKLEISEEINI